MEVADESERKEKSELYGNSDDSVVIFGVVCFGKSLLFRQVMYLP